MQRPLFIWSRIPEHKLGTRLAVDRPTGDEMRRAIAGAVAVVAALAVLGAAWAHGPTRQKVRESIEIDAPQARSGR